MEFSIKWKLLGSFSLAMFVPLMIHLGGGSGILSLGVGVVMVCILSSYSYYRIQGALSAIRDNLAPLSLKDMPPLNQHPDELTAAMLWSDRLIDSVEASMSRMGEGLPVPKSYQPGEHVTFRAQLSSGDGCIGECITYTTKGNSGLNIPHFDAVRNEEIFHQSIDSLKGKLEKLKDLIRTEKDKGIIDFQIYFLQDQNFIEGFLTNNGKGMGIDLSLETLFQEFIFRLESTHNALIRSRVKDLIDLKNQLAEEILGTIADSTSHENQLRDKIVLVQSLLPSEVLKLSAAGVKGVASRDGTPSSHAQILLESLGICSVSELDSWCEIPDGEKVLIDPTEKVLVLNPMGQEINKLEGMESERQHRVKHQPMALGSGEEIQVKANLNIPKDVHRSLSYGPDGIGLFRSEIAMLGQQVLPDEEKLFEDYSRITRAYSERPVTMRMLDIGGDKLAGITSHAEENPCMGQRSMRLLLANPDLFRTQFRAMRRACHGQTSIIFPMVGSIDEIDDIMDRIHFYADELRREGHELKPVRYGVMVEVPSVALRFEDLVDRFDVFNIGTNDLTQYTLAADRNNQEVATYYSPISPAVISLVARVARIGAAAHKEVCLCGEAASNPLAFPLWVGLGLRHFSIPYRGIPELKGVLGDHHLEDCRSLAQDVLSLNSNKAVQERLALYQEACLEPSRA